MRETKLTWKTPDFRALIAGETSAQSGPFSLATRKGSRFFSRPLSEEDGRIEGKAAAVFAFQQLESLSE